MCGRYTLTTSISTVASLFGVSPTIEASPRYNVAPTQEVVSILSNGSAHLDWLQWGLIPSWAKDGSIGSKMINARAETLAEKPSFKRLLRSKRCLVVADGFYEWKKENGGKTPMYITLKDHDLWLDSQLHDEHALLPLLKPYNADEMAARAVSRLVNNPKSEGAELIA